MYANITLIDIPYWWDCNKESLEATIHLIRPDLIPKLGNGIPISKSPPKEKNQHFL